MSTRTPSEEQVRAALGEILSWSEIARSPQLAKFLNHIVEAKLSGDEGSIKAYSIAVDVFGRPQSFDPQADPIVRVQARRLRGLIQEFYRQGLGSSPVRITLPVGRYVPDFVLEGGEGPESPTVEPDAGRDETPTKRAEEPKRLGRHFWLQAGAALALVLALGLLLIGLQVFRTPSVDPVLAAMPNEPFVYVSDIRNETGNAALDPFTARVTDNISSLIAQYEDTQVRFVSPGSTVASRPGNFIISGNVAMSGTSVLVSAVLTDAVSGVAVWQNSVELPAPTADGAAIAATAARKFMREVGPFRGPLHAPGRRWLDQHAPQIPAVNEYVCLLAFRYARETSNATAVAKAIDCFERLMRDETDLPLALAAQAWLEGRVIYAGVAPGDRIDIALSRQIENIGRALDLAPESPFVHEQYANIQSWLDNYEIAQRNFAIALGFQPLNTDARASYAVSLARTADWSGAAQQAQFAIADTPFPSPWYYLMPSIIALRDGRYLQAIEDGRIATQANDVGLVTALAAAGHAQDQQTINEYRPRLLSSETIRRVGILPWLELRIKDAQLVELLAEGLRSSGIPEASLSGPY